MLYRTRQMSWMAMQRKTITLLARRVRESPRVPKYFCESALFSFSLGSCALLWESQVLNVLLG